MRRTGLLPLVGVPPEPVVQVLVSSGSSGSSGRARVSGRGDRSALVERGVGAGQGVHLVARLKAVLHVAAGGGGSKQIYYTIYLKFSFSAEDNY